MSWMTKKAIATQIALTGFVAGAMERSRAGEREKGGVLVEYIGVILVVVAIVGIVVAFVGNSTLDETIVGKIEDAVNKLTV